MSELPEGRYPFGQDSVRVIGPGGSDTLHIGPLDHELEGRWMVERMRELIEAESEEGRSMNPYAKGAFLVLGVLSGLAVVWAWWQ